MIFNESNFDEEVLGSDEPILVDFWATWCGPCLALTPIVEKLAEEVSGAKVGKVNVDENSDLAQKYAVSAIPTILFFKGGEVVERMVGLQTEEALREKLESLK